MKTIQRIEREDFKEMAQIIQHGWQYDNPSITLLEAEQDGDNEYNYVVGDLVVVVDQGNETNYYLLEKDDWNYPTADYTYQDVVEDMAIEWPGDTENNTIERCLWGLAAVADLAVDSNYTGECSIICEQQYYGPYYPTDYVKDEDPGSDKPMVFANKEEAQEWIDKQEEGTYYLSHNESGRPVYTIVGV